MISSTETLEYLMLLLQIIICFEIYILFYSFGQEVGTNPETDKTIHTSVIEDLMDALYLYPMSHLLNRFHFFHLFYKQTWKFTWKFPSTASTTPTQRYHCLLALCAI